MLIYLYNYYLNSLLNCFSANLPIITLVAMAKQDPYLVLCFTVRIHFVNNECLSEQ